MTLDKQFTDWELSKRTVEEEFGSWDGFFLAREQWRVEEGIISPQQELDLENDL